MLNSSSGSFQLVPSTSFESRYPQTPSNQIRTPQSDQDQDNNYHDDHSDFNNDFDDTDDYDDAAHEYPHEGLEQRLKLDQDVLAGKRLDHSMFLPPAHRSGSECSPREEFLVHAFGPSGFKLHGTSVSSNDELDDSLSDDSSGNNRETTSSRHGATLVDADTELKMSFNELEADIRGAMHQNSHHQHSARLPELAGLPHQSFAASSHGSFGLNRSGNFPRSSQDLHHIPMFGQSQETRPHLLQSQKETTYFPREQQLHSPSRTPLAKTPHDKVGSGIQTPTKWLRDEDERLRVAVARFGGKNWKMIAETLGNGRTDVQCLHRWNKVLKPGLIKGPWTPEEDRILTGLITRYGVGKIRWCDLALHLPGRIGKQCRERWCNHLDSRIRKGQWTPEEDDMVFRWQQKLGNKWSEIAKLLPGRTENAVKNRFNSAARRKWLMNQANKTPTTSAAPATPAAPSQSQLSPHTQLRQQQTLLQSASSHQEGNIYNVSTIPYGGGKVTPLPSTETIMEHQQHNPIPPLGRQNFLHHFAPPGAPPTNALLPGSLEGPPLPVFRPAAALGSEPGFQHDKPPDIVKAPDSISLAPSTFVPPPLNSLFPPPPMGASRSLHHLPNSPVGSEAPITPVFPFPAHLPTQVQSDSVLTPAKPKPGGDLVKEGEPPLLQLKEEKIERDGLVLDASADAPAAHAGPDPSVPMDDENMNSFLDSVALELDDIME
ncbi:Transcriptional activator Myb [Phytophthora citrophthora]|uniref:Transcriptional activator Myb n=1 Tax=Phytophthora citrophthora TaxID=4793 RepID=A0AAD9LTI0_9STRA|nr:Transcriptional activator Myb [Phytophthora citrophthora]